MSRKNKQNALIFLGLVVLMTALLATSLSQMEFQPGMPLPALEGREVVIPESAQSRSATLPTNSLLLPILGIILASFLLVMLYRWIMGSTRKDLPKAFLILLGIISILILISYMLPSFSGETVKPPIPSPSPTFDTTPLGPTPPGLVWLVGICLAMLGAFLFYSWLASRRKPDQASLLALEIEKASQNILAGMNLDEVILRCYQQMSQVLRQEGGIERQDFMTPTEFERELSAAGFPYAPVHQLTHLFEIVRYGNWTPNSSDEQEALDSLQKIISHLRDRKERRADG